MGRKTKEVDLAAELQNEYDRWEELYTHGGSDPGWTDGVNLDLVRNHIIYYKRQVEETMEPSKYPDIYYRELPPVVPKDYMVRKDEIKAAALKSFEGYKTSKDYRYLLQKTADLDEKEKKMVYLPAILGYVEGLERAIETNDYVWMRRHENPRTYLDSFSQCVIRVKELREQRRHKNVQLDMFSMMCT
jgi:hypothetical protein